MSHPFREDSADAETRALRLEAELSELRHEIARLRERSSDESLKLENARLREENSTLKIALETRRRELAKAGLGPLPRRDHASEAGRALLVLFVSAVACLIVFGALLVSMVRK